MAFPGNTPGRARDKAHSQLPGKWSPAWSGFVLRGGMLIKQSPEMLKLQLELYPFFICFSMQSNGRICPGLLIAARSLYKIIEFSGPFSLKRRINIKKGDIPGWCH